VPYHSETYANDIRPIVLDWMTNAGRGKNVADAALSIVNRAQKNLWERKPWSNLVTQVTVALTNNQYTFPSDFGRVIDVWADMSGTGVADYWYYEADNYERGYKLVDSFSKDTGHSWVIEFFYPQGSAVKMRYQKVLEDFVGTGTEYSFFPANLVLLEAQKINTREKGNVKEWQMLKGDYEEALKDYCSANLWVNADTLPRMNDRMGNELIPGSYSLSGESSGSYSSLPNSHII